MYHLPKTDFGTYQKLQIVYVSAKEHLYENELNERVNE